MNEVVIEVDDEIKRLDFGEALTSGSKYKVIVPKGAGTVGEGELIIFVPPDLERLLPKEMRAFTPVVAARASLSPDGADASGVLSTNTDVLATLGRRLCMQFVRLPACLRSTTNAENMALGHVGMTLFILASGSSNDAALIYKGDKGDKGDSAYEVWAKLHDGMSLEAYFEAIRGPSGESAYEIAVRRGSTLTEAEWIASLKGKSGDKGEQGPVGPQGPIGPQGEKGDGLGEESVREIAEEEALAVLARGSQDIVEETTNAVSGIYDGSFEEINRQIEENDKSCVHYDGNDDKNESEKAQARSNIGAAAESHTHTTGEIEGIDNLVLDVEPINEAIRTLSDGKLDRPEQDGDEGQVLGRGAGGALVWVDNSGGGVTQEELEAAIAGRMPSVPASEDSVGKYLHIDRVVKDEVTGEITQVFLSWKKPEGGGGLEGVKTEVEPDEAVTIKPVHGWMNIDLLTGEMRGVGKISLENPRAITYLFEDGEKEIYEERVANLADIRTEAEITALAEDAVKTNPMPTDGASDGSVAARVIALETAITGVAADLAAAIGEEA